MDSRKNHPSRNSKPTVSSANATQLKKAIQWIVNKSSFSNVTLHGNVKWAPHQLVMLIVLWAWSDRKQMTNAFDDAAQRCQRLFDVLSVATFQGMMRALVVYMSLDAVPNSDAAGGTGGFSDWKMVTVGRRWITI